VLTAGGRPDFLRAAVESLLRQRDVETDIVVVANGCEAVEGVPDGVRVLALPDDAGIPGGRNAGAAQVDGELLFFLDDDARLATPDALVRAAAELAAEPRLALVQLGPQALGGGARSRDWVPRLRVGDSTRPSEITVVWEGAVAVRRDVFEAVGRWPADFRYVHEGVDLGWRIMDAGYRMRYAGDIAVLHPSPTGRAHAYSHYFRARNRVWLARRHLPLPLGVLYVCAFALRAAPRLRSLADARESARGYRDGLRGPAGRRRPLRARTLLRMTRAGRPPIM
jgi:GT2 family glycosyltransferase